MNSVVRDDATFAAGEQASGQSGFWIPLFLTALLLFAPSATRFLLGTSSNAPGLIVVCLALWGIATAQGSFVRGSNAYWGLLFSIPLVVALALHLFIAVNLPRIPQNIDLGRAAASLVAVPLIAVAAGIVADWLNVTPARQIGRITAAMRVILLLVGLWSYFGVQPPSPLTLWQPSFPFTEPSHFALVAAPFIIDGCVRGSSRQALAWLAVWLLIALLNNSLSLVVVAAVAAAVSLPIPYMIAGVSGAGLIALQLDLQYYAERLDFSQDSENLSSLVYRQGWELLYEGITYSGGWGVGFQQLGFAPLNVPTSDLIYSILGNDLNLQDGSFLGAKAISELGIFGMVLVVIFGVIAIRAAVGLRALSALSSEDQQDNLRFALAAICGFAVEVFLRGAGYFSSTVVVVGAACLALRTLRRQSDSAG